LVVDFEKLKRQLSARKMGHTRRMARLGAARRRLEDGIAAHRRNIDASLESITLLEAEVAELDEVERDVEARSRSRRSVAPPVEAVSRLDLFDQAAVNADMEARGAVHDEEVVSLARVAIRTRSDDGFVWKSPVGIAAAADDEAAQSVDPRLPQVNEHLRRALAIPGYVHLAHAVSVQWMGDDILDMAVRFADERETPMLALRDEFAGHAIDRTAAMGRGAAWVEQAKKGVKRDV
jgi:hypothetical protein